MMFLAVTVRNHNETVLNQLAFNVTALRHYQVFRVQ